MQNDLYLDDDVDEGVYFQYCGYFSQELIKSSVDILDRRTRSDSVPSPVRRKLLNAFIEVSQNIVHYSHESLTGADVDEGEIRFGTIEITEAGGEFSISSSNPVSEAEARRLHERIGALAELDQEALKARYQAALRNDGEAGSKGAGIGFIRLARDSSRQLQFSFVDAPINPEIKIFNLTVTVA
jgi:hypothetical protein